MSTSGTQIAVVGATGAVGREMITVLHERGLPLENVRLLASSRSAGAEVQLGNRQVVVEELKPESFQGVDIALFSAGAAISQQYAPHAVKAGTVVIDNSSAFRMDPSVALIVPEVNADVLRSKLDQMKNGQGIVIANPNCSTIQLVVVLKPIHERAGLKRVIVSTYQSVSGAGQKGMDELFQQTLGLMNQQEVKVKKFPHRIAFNCIPQCDDFLENGYTKEEMKVVNESRKILGNEKLRLTATAVRVPVFCSHSEAVNVETEKPLEIDELRAILRESPGIMLIDNPGAKEYPLAINAVGTDATYVGRLRKDDSTENAFNMWIVADNLRKGAATNAVQIAEIVMEHQKRH